MTHSSATTYPVSIASLLDVSPPQYDCRMKPAPEELMKESADLKVLFFKNAGMTQKDAAAAWSLGNQSNLAHYLNGRQTLSLEVAIKFAKGLGVSIEDFSPRLARQARLLLRSVDVPQTPHISLSKAAVSCCRTFIHAIRQQKPDQLPLAIAEAAKN